MYVILVIWLSSDHGTAWWPTQKWCALDYINDCSYHVHNLNLSMAMHKCTEAELRVCSTLLFPYQFSGISLTLNGVSYTNNSIVTITLQGRWKHLRVGQAQSRRAQFINIHCITSFYELSVDDGKIAFFPKRFLGKNERRVGMKRWFRHRRKSSSTTKRTARHLYMSMRCARQHSCSGQECD